MQKCPTVRFEFSISFKHNVISGWPFAYKIIAFLPNIKNLAKILVLYGCDFINRKRTIRVECMYTSVFLEVGGIN